MFSPLHGKNYSNDIQFYDYFCFDLYVKQNTTALKIQSQKKNKRIESNRWRFTHILIVNKLKLQYSTHATEGHKQQSRRGGIVKALLRGKASINTLPNDQDF